MKLPRDLSGLELASRLERIGYRIVRQTGSHIRLTRSSQGREHHVTIPSHQTLRVGTLSGILNAVASHLESSREEVRKQLLR